MRSKIWVLFCVLIGYQSIDAQDVISPAPEHFEKFNHVDNGWCASDATISLLLPDGNTLWLWGDCIIGEKESTFDVKNGAATMINNAAIIEQNGMMSAYYQGSMEQPSSLIPGEGADIFWPEHATIENDTLKIFAIRIIHEDNVSELTEKMGQMRFYVDGMYLLDPLYQFILQQPDPGFYSLREIAPDNFFRSEFFNQHFIYTRLKDDMFYLLPLENTGTLVIAIGSARRFNRAELGRFHTLEPWVLSMMKCHWGTTHSQQKVPSEHSSIHQRLTASLQNFGRSRLTNRECDIAQMILRGHSSKSAALKLDISHETVKTHRRHIYRKLDLRSQSELFSLFLNALTTQGRVSEYADPLEAYLT